MERVPVCAQCFSLGLSFETLKQLRQLDTFSLLRSNTLPSIGVSGLVRGAEAELRSYDAEIGRLHSMISAIQAHKNELIFHQTRLKSLLSPIRKLPREILIEIFSHCDLKISLGCPDFQTNILGRVWHPTIISTPRIWSNIEYNISDRSLDEESRMQNQLSHILELSGSCPLSVMMYYYHSDYWIDDPLESLSPVLKCLVETSRWVSLRLDAESSTSVIEFWGLERRLHLFDPSSS
jgi:hypothetical protein